MQTVPTGQLLFPHKVCERNGKEVPMKSSRRLIDLWQRGANQEWFEDENSTQRYICCRIFTYHWNAVGQTSFSAHLHIFDCKTPAVFFVENDDELCQTKLLEANTWRCHKCFCRSWRKDKHDVKVWGPAELKFLSLLLLQSHLLCVQEASHTHAVCIRIALIINSGAIKMRVTPRRSFSFLCW